MLKKVTVLTAGMTVLAFGVLLAVLPVPEPAPGPAPGPNPKPAQPPSPGQPAGNANGFILEKIRVFDGNTLHGPTTLIVTDGKVAGIGDGVTRPEGLRVIDGSGQTVLPGFFDAHTHTFGSALRDSLLFGVTSTLDMFTSPALITNMASDRNSFDQTDQAALFSAGMLATVEGGHGTQYGIPIDTLQGPDEAPAWVAARKAEGSDFIKLVYMPDNPRLPSLDLETASAVIDAAHSEDLLAIAHIARADDAEELLDAGIDGFVHIFADVPASESLINKSRQNGVFVIPTLAVIAMVNGLAPGKQLLDDTDLAPYLDSSQRNNLAGDFGGKIPGFSLDIALANVGRFHAAGVPVLAGSDAPNPGTAHGATLHQELELLTRAGLSASQALAAATSLPAAIFSAAGRGVIAPGARADLVLVSGNPTEDIKATRAIKEVFRNGYAVSRSRDLPTQSSDMVLPAALGDFDGGISAPEGLTWQPTSDNMMGGRSEANLEPIDSGAGGSAGALRVQATVTTGFPYPWAGAYVGLASEGSTASVEPYSTVAFDVRGTPARYRLMLFTADAYGAPPTREFDVSEEWTRVSLALSDFGELDAGRFTGMAIVSPMLAGDYQFDIDNVEMMR